MAPLPARARRRGSSSIRGPALLLLSFFGLVLLVAAAGWARTGGGIGDRVDFASTSMPSSSSSSSSASSSPPPLLLRSGTVDVRPGRGLMATRLSHSVGRRLLSEASSSAPSSPAASADVTAAPIAATTDARWGPLRSRGSPWSPGALVSSFLQRHFSSSRSSPSPSSSAAAPRQLVISFSSAPPPHGAAEALSKVLHRHGGSLGSFLPEASFVAVGSARAAAAVLALVPGVAAVGELPPESKLAPELVGDVLLVGGGSGGDGEEEGGEERETKTRTTTLAVVFPRLGRAAGGTGAAGGEAKKGRCGDDGYDPSAAAAADWARPLSLLPLLGGGEGDRGGGSVRVAGRQGRHVLLVEVVERRDASSSSSSPSPSSPPLASRVAGWLAAQPATHWLSPATLEASARNWQASAIIQSGKGAPSSSGSAAADAATHPLWAANVTGRGQVIGGGDSGLDLSHCFFADPEVPIELKAAGSSGAGGGWRGFFGGGNGAGGGGSVFESERHRKIRLYRSTASAGASSLTGGGNGHGTHTMGSLCGSPFDPGSSPKAAAYRGMAPDAKLAFSDLSSERANSGPKNSKSSGGAILVPGDMGGDYYRFAYDAGARVHSDSWGSASLEYDYMASEVDAFTFKRQDFLPVLAAGNEGAASASPSRGVTTVTAPATSKNCVAVGASQSAYAHGAVAAGSAFSLHKLTVSQQQQRQSGGEGASADAAAAAPTEVESFRVVQAQFGGRLSSLYGRRLPLAAATPPDACGNLQNAAAVPGSVLIAARGGCTFADKAAAAQSAGAVALLVYDDRISDFFIPAASNGNGGNDAGKDLTIPAAALPRRVGQLLASAAAASSGDGGGKSSSPPSPPSSPSPTRITVSFGPPPSAGDPWDSLADFSSKGPTPDGRIKPDLVAPGVLQSAAASSTVGEGGGGGGDGEGLFGRAASSSSGSKCPLRTMQGTSMATPVVAGAAALVRSYFAQGFYPGGAADPSRAHEAGGALVKAVLAAGAAPLDGFESDTGLPLAPPPSYRMGFGRVHLARSLPLLSSAAAPAAGKKAAAAAAPTGWSLQVVDRAPISGGESHRFCLRSTGGPLTVVLAWHDAPGAPSSGKALVNDLDLVVRAAGLGGLPLVGNGGGGGGGGGGKGGGGGERDGGGSSANGVPPADRLNNVESVAVAYLPPGDVSIEVRASSVPRGPQPYALAALGEFTGVLASAHNPFVNAQAAAAAAAASANGAGRCDVVVATVRKGPEGVVARRDVEFEFGTAAGGGAGAFECALAAGGDDVGGDKSSGSSSSWKPCSSPVSFRALEDGRHVFRVRAQGEASAALRAFEVDATPPALWWRQGGQGENLPPSSPPSSSSAAATISFGADDASAVSFRCRLELLDQGTGARPLPAGSPAGMLRLWTAAEAVAATVASPSATAASASAAAKTSSSSPRLAAQLAAASVSPASVPGVGRSRAVKLGEWQSNCTSPASFAWLPPGRWRASVDARDAAGNAAPAPLSHEWVVSGVPSSVASRTPFIVAGPYGPSNSSAAEFELRALTSEGRLEAVAASDAPQCQLLPLGSGGDPSSAPGAPVEGRQPAPAAGSEEDRAWTSCGSKPGFASYGKLGDGGYQFLVRFGGGSGGSGGSGGRRRRRSLSAANSSSTTAAAPSASASTKAAAAAAAAPAPAPLPLSAAKATFSVFGVDTTPPNVTITDPPPSVLPKGTLEVAFSAQEPAAFTCVLTSSTKDAPAPAAAAAAKDAKKKMPAVSTSSAAAPVSITTFPCVSPAAYSSLPDGSYQFSVVATDAVGNTSPPPSQRGSSSPSPSSSSSQLSFVVDTLPPDVPAPALDPPLASRNGSFVATFAEVSDAGSGVAKTQCRLRLLAAPAGTAAEGRAASEEGSFEDCSSPFAASNLSRGRWGLTVRAVDAAGNAAESSEVSFYVDDSPPQGAAVTSSPPGDRPVPSKVTFSFAAPPDAASAPVTKWECSLARVKAGGEEKSVSNAAAPRGGGEQGEKEGQRGALPQSRSWQKCSSPMVFKRLKSGNYSFAARATDAAGNAGAPTKASTFAVDASLPVPRDETESGDGGGGVSGFFSGIGDWFSSLSGWRLWAVIAGGVALAVLLATVVCCCCCSSPSRSSTSSRQQQQHSLGQRQDPDAAALAAALAASARERDAAAAAAASREREALERAVQASREEELVRRAIEKSLVEK